MIQLFRGFFQSKIGIAVTLAFLGLIAIAFASSDVANTGTFGGVTGGDRVAVIGERRVDSSDLRANATNALEQLRQQNPTLTMESFIANDGLARVLDTMISRYAIAETARMSGLRAGARLVDSEIVSAPEFRSVDGNFDVEAFRAALRQQGLNEDLVRNDLAMGLFARQLIVPIAAVPQLPQSMVERFTRLRLESRSGTVGLMLASVYAPEDDPTDEQLQAFYDENRADYIRPERRVLRYAAFGDEAVGELPTPTEAQIQERYEQNIDRYRELEMRSFSQLIVPTQAAAQAIVEEVAGGISLEASAQDKGLSVTSLPLVSREELTGNASEAVAEAAFAANRGAIAEPAQGGLGWYVLRVEEVQTREGRSLEDVRDDIVLALSTEYRRDAINDLTVRIEDEFASGRSLSEVAEEIGVELQTTDPITATGQVYGEQRSAPPILARVVPVAFEMEEAEPQLAEIEPGQTFLIYDVSQVTRSATAPLDEIRDQVVLNWRIDAGMRAAGEGASRVLARIAEGSSMAEAIGAEEVTLPAPQSLSLSRAQVEQSGNMTQTVALFFSMAEGTSKRLESREALGWFVVQLDDITAPEVDPASIEVLQTQQQLLSLIGDEYVAQLVAAAEKDIEIEINQVAVDAVGAQLTGQVN